MRSLHRRECTLRAGRQERSEFSRNLGGRRTPLVSSPKASDISRMPLHAFRLRRPRGVRSFHLAGHSGSGRLLLLFLMFLTPLYVFLLWDVKLFFFFGVVVLWLFFRLLRAPASATEPDRA